jgi:hypothetical protein
MEDIFEYIPCGPSHKKVYEYVDWVYRYMKYMGALRDTSSENTSRVMDTIAPT